MTGTSYDGTIPLAAATTGVEGLEAIIPIAPNTSYYHYYRSNGLVRHPGGYMGEDIDVLYNWVHSGYPARREYCDGSVRDVDMAAGIDRVTGDYNDFWEGRDYIHDLQPMKAALLMAHGFNDWNVMPEHSYRIYDAVRAKGNPVQVYYHQSGHGGEPPMRMMNRWFTRYLYGVDNGVEDDARAWIVREDDKQSEPTPYADFPNPDAQPVTLHLQPTRDGDGTLELAIKGKPGHATLIDDVSLTGKMLAQAEHSKNRLLFSTPELQAPLHLSGLARLTIKLSCSKPAANLSVWLVSLPWTDSPRKITENIVTRGWADPQNHESLRISKPLEPGKFYELSFDLQPDDQIIPAGQRLGLMIFSSDRDFTLWPEAGTELTVRLGGTSIELPIVGGEKSFKRATGLKK
jgi:X-Pro dipeptidyl-peptidase